MPDDFHAALAAALAGDSDALAPWADARAAAAGLSVHRNSIAKACADALVAQFPTVTRVVGPRWMTAAAVAYAGAHPPQHAALFDYGDGFPAWLSAFPPAAGMPYLAGLAELDWLSTCADVAADAPPLDPAALAGLAAADLGGYGLVLHPATAFAWFQDSIPSLWLALQTHDGKTGLELGDAPEGLMFVRPQLVHDRRTLSAGDHALLTAVSAGRSLAAAALSALDAEPSFDLSTAFAELIAAGAFTAIRTLS